MDVFPDSLVTKTVDFSFSRNRMRFDLSHGLFSSAAVDAGTRMLLTLAAGALDLTGFESIVDLGCGAGALGIPLARVADRPLTATDRDALAVVFTRHNAERNGARAVVQAALGLYAPPSPSGRRLYVSNLPAKAGAPVLARMAEALCGAATDGSYAAAVIVKPLGAFLDATLRDAGAVVTHRASSANHESRLFTTERPVVNSAAADAPATDGASPPPAGPLPREYLRTTAQFQGPRRQYTLRTVWGLPEFDGLGYRTALAFDLLGSARPAGSILMYGCGQGHLPVGVAQVAPRARLTIADRDLLALLTTATQLPTEADSRLVYGPGALASCAEPGSIDWLIVNDDPVPGSRWSEELVMVGTHVLDPRGRLILVSGSTPVARFERSASGRFRHVEERRMHGYRASLFGRRD